MLIKLSRLSLLSILLSIGLVIPSVIQAQGDHDLSAEEFALVERFVDASQMVETYTSAEIVYSESDNNQSSIAFPISASFSFTSSEIDFDGIIVLDEGATYNATGELMVSVRNDDFANEHTEYVFIAEAVMFDKTLYIQSDYLTTADEWLVIEGQGDIPESLNDTNIDSLIDFLSYDDPDEIQDIIFSDAELLAPFVESIDVTEITLEDETTAERISLTIRNEKFHDLINTLLADDPDASFISQLTAEQVGGEAIFEITINEAGQVIVLHSLLASTYKDIDLHALNSEQPENSFLSMELLSTQTVTYANINAEVEPIVMPE